MSTVERSDPFGGRLGFALGGDGGVTRLVDPRYLLEIKLSAAAGDAS